MKDIDDKELDTAIALGDAICNELGICCEERGQAIFAVWKKLQQFKAEKETQQKTHQRELSRDFGFAALFATT